MKKIILIQLLIFAAPVIFHLSSKDELLGLIEDKRPVHRSENLMAIHRSEAGGRIEAPSNRGILVYTVKRGDSWWKIAQEHGVKNEKDLIRYNNDAKLLPGARIKIPPELMESP